MCSLYGARISSESRAPVTTVLVLSTRVKSFHAAVAGKHEAEALPALPSHFRLDLSNLLALVAHDRAPRIKMNGRI